MKNKRRILIPVDQRERDGSGPSHRNETDREYWTRKAKGWSLVAVIYFAMTTFIAFLAKGDFLPNLIDAQVLLFASAAITAITAIFLRALTLLDPNP